MKLIFIQCKAMQTRSFSFQFGSDNWSAIGARNMKCGMNIDCKYIYLLYELCVKMLFINLQLYGNQTNLI